jgi:membrane associated rhomboid family serine protease
VFPLKDNIPTDRFPVVTVALIALNVVVYLVLQGGGLGLPAGGEGTPWGATEYGARPCELSGECADRGDVSTPLTVLTSMFMHGSLLHIAGNLLFLWIFGNNVEDTMGRVRFLAFYLAGGVAAIAAQTLIDTGSPVPTIGASGAVSAVLGGYLLLYPHARVITLVFIVVFFTVVELPALLVLGLWFLLQVVNGATESAGESGVATFAHIGGFVFGLLVVRLLARRAKPVPPRYPVY